MTIIKKYLSLSIVVKHNKIQKVCILKNKLNFPEELLYENIAIDSKLQLPEQNTSDEELQKYLSTLHNNFDEWFK